MLSLANTRLVAVAPAPPHIIALVGLRTQKTGHLGFQNLLHGALNQFAKKILAADTRLPSRQNLNTLSLASHFGLLLTNVVLVNNILRNRTGGSLTLATQWLLQNFTDSIFYPVEWVEPCEVVSSEFPHHLNNGRLLEHFEQGAMTYRTKGIQQMTPTNFVEVSPELARDKGLEDGSMVRLRSQYGEAEVPVLVTDRVEGSQLHMLLNSVLQPVNRLTGPNVDRATHTPAYKETSVHMTLLPGKQPNPLPKTNFRHGKPTPQTGGVGDDGSCGDALAAFEDHSFAGQNLRNRQTDTTVAPDSRAASQK